MMPLRGTGESITVARRLEHTLLRADATLAQIEALCSEAADLDLLAVCISPYWVERAVAVLSGTPVRVVTTCGFPLGSELTEVKAAQATAALDLGAAEVDMVMNVGALKSGMTDWVRADIEAVTTACHARGGTLKVILEMGYLTPDEKRLACTIAAESGADFVKTSTGFGAGGATIEDVALMRSLVPATVGVKAAGGIRDLDTALAMITAGADRIGTSAGAAIARAARAMEDE